MVDQHWESALHVAVTHQNTEAVQLLLLGGCKMDKVEENRKTPLMLAAECGFADIIVLLLNGGLFAYLLLKPQCEKHVNLCMPI